MHGLACGEGNGWFEGGADSYTCKLCFDQSGKSFTSITAYYAKSVSPRDPTLLQNLISHHPKLISVKRHKKNNGTTTLDASEDKEFLQFYSKYEKYLDDTVILDVAAATTEGLPSSSNKNKASNVLVASHKNQPLNALHPC
jgi:hypothetical protein